MFSDLTSISRKNVGLVALIGVLCFAFLIILGFADKNPAGACFQREAYILMTVFGNLGFIDCRWHLRCWGRNPWCM
ncbi:MAG: hypothetical protein ACLRMZ_01150 [Blautia marasmi]